MLHYISGVYLLPNGILAFYGTCYHMLKLG